MCFKQVQKCDSILRNGEEEEEENKRAPSPGSTALDECMCLWFIRLLFLSGSVIQLFQSDTFSCGHRFAYDGVTSFRCETD